MAGPSRASDDGLVGQTVAGRYEVVRLIGRGGMGSIYEVRHLKLRRSFALKQLAPALVDDAEALTRFQREADVVASLRHPNIVEIVDWETLPDGSPCIVMELLRGEDLSTRLERKGPMSWSELAVICDQVLSALAVTHRAGIVHRDLKPQNIFLTVDDAGEEHAKLLDFGVSKVRTAGRLTGDDQRVGTPAYMSPEQADGQTDQIGPATDVWAMGAILHEMATAKLAFPATSAPSMLYRICHGSPAPLGRDDAPPGFVALLGDLLSRDPARRIVDVETLRRRLRSSLEGQANLAPISLQRVATDAPWPTPHTTLSGASGQLHGRARPQQRVPRWSLAVAAGLVLGLGAVGGGLLWLRPSVEVPVAPIARTSPIAKTSPSERVPPEMVVTPLPTPRRIQLRLTPGSAKVRLDDVAVDGAAILLPADDRPHTLRVTAGGYVGHVQTVDAATAPILDVRLKARARPPRPAPSSPSKPARESSSPKPLDP